MNDIWTEEVIETFLGLVNNPDRLGYTEIARRLSARFDYTFTKNACIGKARRLGVPPRPVWEGNTYRIPKRKLRLVDNPGIPIEELERNTCKFILDKVESRPPYSYCGLPVANEGGSWCKVHIEKVYAKRAS